MAHSRTLSLSIFMKRKALPADEYLAETSQNKKLPLDEERQLTLNGLSDVNLKMEPKIGVEPTTC